MDVHSEFSQCFYAIRECGLFLLLSTSPSRATYYKLVEFCQLIVVLALGELLGLSNFQPSSIEPKFLAIQNFESQCFLLQPFTKVE